jgi:uncharacterized protein YcfL
MNRYVLLALLALTACSNKKVTPENRQQAILEEMAQVKAAYFKTVDSLEELKVKDSSSARQAELMKLLVVADSQKNIVLIPLQKELDSLAIHLIK